jgi:hypothetical protein
MKRTAFTKVAGSLLIIAILASGCASTTVLHTTPANADVYVKGQRLGETPYSYSDRKIAGTFTLVTLKKEGYEDYNTTIRKNKRLNIGALISGLFFIYPLFWIMGYDEAHSYDLEKVEVSTQPVAVIEPAKTETQARVAPVKDLPDYIDLPTSSRVEKLLSQGQVDKAIEYAEEQEGVFQYGCFYTIAQYYLDKGDYANAEDFFNRSGKIKEGNVKIAEAMMKGEKRTEQNIPAENDAGNLPADRGEKNLPAENPEMKLTGEDNRIIITVDSVVRLSTQPQDLVTVLEYNNSSLSTRPARNADYVLVYFDRTVKEALNLTSYKQYLANVTLSDQLGKNYAIILERGHNYIRTPGGGQILWNPAAPHPEGVIISYSYMMFFMPVGSTPIRLNYVYNYKNDKNDRKINTGTLTIDLTP